jgi:integrase
MAAPKMERTRYPGIYKRGGRYVVTWQHRGKQYKSFHPTLAEAREAKGSRAAGERRPASRVCFGDYFAEWIDGYAGRTARGFSETSRTEYRRVLEGRALPCWGSWRLSEIEPTDVRDVLGEARRDGASTSEIRKLRAALSVMFATALEDGELSSNPARGVRIPVAVGDAHLDERAKALTRGELSVLLAAIAPEWRTFFEFLAHTGLRISEVIGLRWEHLDLGERARVRVREQFYKGERKRLKSGAGRRLLPLSAGMAAKLIEHRRDTYRGEAEPVFARRGGRELYPQNIARDVLKEAAGPLGLGWVSFHTFRHTCASLLFEAGRDVKQVAEWLGHADPSFTLRTYVHLMDEGIGDAAFMDEAVQVGKGWATSHPETAANQTEPETAKILD